MTPSMLILYAFQDQYANYVIQKTLQLAPREAALSLVESIREHLSLMRNSSGGRRMLTKIAKRFPVRYVLVQWVNCIFLCVCAI